MKKYILTLALCVITLPTLASANTTGYAWSESVGWLDFSNAVVSDTDMTGYAYNDNTGWLVLSHITNTNGTLSGYAWSESIGWFDFSNVYIEDSQLKGFAYNDNTGWLNFTDTNITTTWAPATPQEPRRRSGSRGGSIAAPIVIGAETTIEALQKEVERLQTILQNLIRTPQTPPPPQTSNTPPLACAEYMTQYIKLGNQNNPLEVQKLQSFLSTYEQESLIQDGVYKQTDFEAVKRYQKKYPQTLSYWSITEPTGYVYISTLQAINAQYCAHTLQTNQ